MTLRRFILATLYALLCVSAMGLCSSCTTYQSVKHPSGWEVVNYTTVMQDSKSEKVYNTEGELILDRSQVDNTPATDVVGDVIGLKKFEGAIGLGGDALTETADALTD